MENDILEKKKAKKPTPFPPEMEDDGPPTGPDGKPLKPRPFAEGGFVDHKQQVKQHAAGFKHHDDHVKAMCGGGMAKGKK
jgi:hypothetical protein